MSQVGLIYGIKARLELDNWVCELGLEGLIAAYIPGVGVPLGV